ncbi:aconitase family protein [Mesorhizobium atlanticum]
MGTSEVDARRSCQTADPALQSAFIDTCRAIVDGQLPEGVTAKDIILAIIGEIGTAGGTGYVIEYAGESDPLAVDGEGV